MTCLLEDYRYDKIDENNCKPCNLSHPLLINENVNFH